MKKVLIIGAGAQGGPCASILARDDSISEIRLADIDLNQAEAVHKRIGSPKIKAVQLDALAMGVEDMGVEDPETEPVPAVS